MTTSEAEKKRFHSYRQVGGIKRCIDDLFGDRLKLSNQQENAAHELSKLIAAKIKLANGETMTEEESAYSKKIGISIMSGMGCHAKGQEVLMYNGALKKVEDVEVDDLLMGDNSTLRRVLRLFNGTAPLYRVKYKKSDEYYDVNDTHILSLKCNHDYKHYKKGDVVNVRIAEYLGWNKKQKSYFLGYKTSVEFPKKDLLIPPYILGIWLGDGCKTLANITCMDREIIDEFVQYGFDIGLNYRADLNGKDHYLTNSKGKKNLFKENLKELGVFDNKHIPLQYLTSCRDDRLELLAGLLDTDGHLAQKGKRSFEITQVRKGLSEQIVYLAQSLGFYASIKEKIIKGKPYYRIHISRGDIESIPTRVKRKQAQSSKNIRWKPENYSFDIISIGIDEYYGFEVDENHLYVLKDFTVTHNSGKDFFSSIMILIFLTIFKDALCTCTANSAKQLKNVLWAEISRIMALSKLLDPTKPHHPKENPTLLEHMYEWQSERVNFRPKEGKSHFAEALTISPHASSDEQAKTLTGRHSKYMLMVIDEAAGVPEPVFENLEGTLTGTVNLILMIFNPIRSKGYAVKSQYEEKDKWVSLRWDCEETAFPDESMTRTIQARNEMMAEKYGKDSNPYRIKIKGLPPVNGNDSFIPWDWIQDAINREIVPDENDPLIIGVDPAAGGDRSVILKRHGGKVDKRIVRFNLADTMEFTGRVVQEIYSSEPAMTVIDPIGVGKGVYDRCREQGHKVMPGDVRRSSTQPERFDKMRDEIAWRVREQFEKGLISIPDDQDLIDQIGALKAKPPDSHGKLKLMSKNEMKRDIGYSPDDWDALCLTYFYNEAIFRKHKDDDDDLEPGRKRRKQPESSGGWLYV